MVDEFPSLFDTRVVLTTTTKYAAKRDSTATPLPPVKASAEDLEFLSANQQLEGFPGKITEAIAAHQPDMKEMVASAKRFGAQVPTEGNRKRHPVFRGRRNGDGSA
jgi:hypothetical protein